MKIKKIYLAINYGKLIGKIVYICLMKMTPEKMKSVLIYRCLSNKQNFFSFFLISVTYLIY